ncbi:MAG TPA: molybdopterin synthase sulfur carrier subunit [Acetobacteraceae bacterium]|jgi:sulfur-carrier protein|nr:molybdopterin synthase sulfur carrier subunit [Acetobacteraceae bacterium]
MPEVTVQLPPALLRLFPGSEPEPTVPASSVAEIIDALDQRWPGMRDRLCDSTPRIRRHMNVFVDGERATLATPVTTTSDVFIMTAISGG